MDYEKIIGQAYDLLADSRDDEAQDLLEACIADIKGSLDGTLADADRYHYWGLCLVGLYEYQQALLKFEQAIGIVPLHEGAMWQIVSLLLYDLDKPELAKDLLEQRLIPAHPQNPQYAEALRDAEAMLRIRQRLASGEVATVGDEDVRSTGEYSELDSHLEDSDADSDLSPDDEELEEPGTASGPARGS